jgi:hypothetical protein
MIVPLQDMTCAPMDFRSSQEARDSSLISSERHLCLHSEQAYLIISSLFDTSNTCLSDWCKSTMIFQRERFVWIEWRYFDHSMTVIFNKWRETHYLLTKSCNRRTRAERSERIMKIVFNKGRNVQIPSKQPFSRCKIIIHLPLFNSHLFDLFDVLARALDLFDHTSTVGKHDRYKHNSPPTLSKEVNVLHQE